MSIISNATGRENEMRNQPTGIEAEIREEREPPDRLIWLAAA
jgi:hypothetical protein